MGFEEIMGIRNVAILGHGGFGEYSYALARYEQAPIEVQEQIVKEAKEGNLRKFHGCAMV